MKKMAKDVVEETQRNGTFVAKATIDGIAAPRHGKAELAGQKPGAGEGHESCFFLRCLMKKRRTRVPALSYLALRAP